MTSFGCNLDRLLASPFVQSCEQKLKHACDDAQKIGLKTLAGVVSRAVLNSLWCYPEIFLKFCDKKAERKIATYAHKKKSEVARSQVQIDPSFMLKGISFTRAAENGTARKLIIYFNGTQGIWQRSMRKIELLHEALDVDIMSFNYRGITNDTPFPYKDKSLVDDGVKIVLDQIEKKGLDPKNIILYGESFGGGIAPCAAVRLQRLGIRVTTVSERSFRSLPEVAEQLLPFVGSKCAHLANRVKWQLNAEEAIKELESKVVVMYHPKDKVIQPPAQLRTAVESDPNLKHVILIEMQDDDTPWEFDNYPILGHFKAHGRPINDREITLLKAALAD